MNVAWAYHEQFGDVIYILRFDTGGMHNHINEFIGSAGALIADSTLSDNFIIHVLRSFQNVILQITQQNMRALCLLVEEFMCQFFVQSERTTKVWRYELTYLTH